MGFNPVLGFLSVSTRGWQDVRNESRRGFNPVLGFLSVSTLSVYRDTTNAELFQSRAGFSECLDNLSFVASCLQEAGFQSRAGFSECLDQSAVGGRPAVVEFQSRAGFSECLDSIPS